MLIPMCQGFAYSCMRPLSIAECSSAACSVLMLTWMLTCAGYDEEARYFDEGVRMAKRHQLKAQALDLLQPAFLAQLGFLREQSLQIVAAALAHDTAPSNFADAALS